MLRSNPATVRIEPMAEMISPTNLAKRTSAILPLKYSVTSDTDISPITVFRKNGSGVYKC